MPRCLIDQSLTTAVVSYPIERGWAGGGSDFELVRDLRAETVAERNVCALLGSIDAVPLLDRFAVVTDIALVSWHSGDVALWTPARPDEVNDVPVALDGVSPTAEALARATLTNFYGIKPAGWDRGLASGEAEIREGVAALQPVESGELSDLVRAWYILTSFPLTTHLLVAPKTMAEQDRAAIAALVSDLTAVIASANERRREMRRNLSDDHGLDRDRLTAFQTEQTTTLSKTARKGWLDLIRRTERGMKISLPEQPSFVTVGEEPG